MIRRWLRRRQLVKFSQERSQPERCPKPKLTEKFWSGVGDDTEDEKRLKMLSASARRLEDLMSQPGWTDLLECRNFYLSLHTANALQIETEDHERFRAACLRAGNNEVFAELNLRITRGRQAANQLREPVKDVNEASYV